MYTYLRMHVASSVKYTAKFPKQIYSSPISHRQHALECTSDAETDRYEVVFYTRVQRKRGKCPISNHLSFVAGTTCFCHADISLLLNFHSFCFHQPDCIRKLSCGWTLEKYWLKSSINKYIEDVESLACNFTASNDVMVVMFAFVVVYIWLWEWVQMHVHYTPPYVVFLRWSKWSILRTTWTITCRKVTSQRNQLSRDYSAEWPTDCLRGQLISVRNVTTCSFQLLVLCV